MASSGRQKEFYTPRVISETLKKDLIQKICKKDSRDIRKALIEAALNMCIFPRPFNEALDSLQSAYSIHQNNQQIKLHLKNAITECIDKNFINEFEKLISSNVDVVFFKTDFLCVVCKILEISIQQEPFVEAAIKNGKIYWRIVDKQKTTPRRENHTEILGEEKTWSMDWKTFRLFKDSGKRSGTVEVNKEQFIDKIMKDYQLFVCEDTKRETQEATIKKKEADEAAAEAAEAEKEAKKAVEGGHTKVLAAEKSLGKEKKKSKNSKEIKEAKKAAQRAETALEKAKRKALSTRATKKAEKKSAEKAEKKLIQIIATAKNETRELAGKIWDELKDIGILNSRSRLSHEWRAISSEYLHLDNLKKGQYYACIKALYNIVNDKTNKEVVYQDRHREMCIYRPEKNLKSWAETARVTHNRENNNYSTRCWDVGVYADLSAHSSKELKEPLDYDHIPSVGRMKIEKELIEKEDIAIVEEEIISIEQSIEEEKNRLREEQIQAQEYERERERALNGEDAETEEEESSDIEIPEDSPKLKKLKKDLKAREKEQEDLNQKISKIILELKNHGDLLWTIAIPRKLHRMGGTYMESLAEQSKSKEHPFLADVRIHLDNLEEETKKNSFSTNKYIKALGAFRYLYRCLLKSHPGKIKEIVCVGTSAHDLFFREDKAIEKLDELFSERIRRAMEIREGSKRIIVIEPELQASSSKIMRKLSYSLAPSLPKRPPKSPGITPVVSDADDGRSPSPPSCVSNSDSDERSVSAPDSADQSNEELSNSRKTKPR